MIVWSQQHKLISDTCLSFRKLEKTYTKVSGSILSRDLMFLKESKFLTRTETDFKFIVLWTIFKNATAKIDTLKMLQGITKEDEKELYKRKQEIALYKNTLKKDFEYAEDKIKTPKTVLDMYNKNLVSLLYVYYFFNKGNFELSRIQKRTVQRIDFMIEYFPTVQEYIQSL